MRATLWVLLLVLAVGVSVLADDGSMAWPVEDCLCIWVDPEASIQAQIDAAPPGSTLCLPEGTWRESLVIDKPLTLRGQGPERTIIQAAIIQDGGWPPQCFG